MISISVVILTLNEESNIGECIKSCLWTDDIVVFDSLSTDRTREIALAHGARVIERAFDNYASQRNAALNNVSYRHGWVLMVDADERVPNDLADEIAAAVTVVDDGTVLFRMRRKDFYLGRWLRRSSGYPTWFARLIRVGRVLVQREINEEYVPDGNIVYLKSHLHHFPFTKGVAYWFERHNRYSSMEATAKLSAQLHPLEWRGALSSDPIERRRTLKRLLYRVPCRPVIVFLYLYFFRLGFLDGRAGLYFSQMRALYEFLIDLKVVEAKRRLRGSAV